MKKVIIIALFSITLIGIAAACNTYQRCPAYTQDTTTQTECDRI